MVLSPGLVCCTAHDSALPGIPARIVWPHGYWVMLAYRYGLPAASTSNKLRQSAHVTANRAAILQVAGMHCLSKQGAAELHALTCCRPCSPLLHACHQSSLPAECATRCSVHSVSLKQATPSHLPAGSQEPHSRMAACRLSPSLLQAFSGACTRLQG